MGSSNLTKWVQSRAWFWAFVTATSICVIAFIVNAAFSEVSPGNYWGLAYGGVGGILMLCIALFGVRRRLTRFTRRFGAGKAQSWVQFHVYGGAVFLLLVLMHTGFRLPNGVLTWWLFASSIWVSVSGLLGVFLQKWIPKILTSGLSVEVLYERIPALVAEIRAKSEETLLGCSEPVKEFYRRHLATAFTSPQVRLIYYVDITGGIQSRMKQFNYLGRLLSSTEKANLDQLESFYKTKLELDAHYSLQRALRGWLYLHVPASFILLLLLGLHVYSILYY